MTLATITLIVEIIFYLVLCAGVVAQFRQQYKWHDRLQAPIVVLNLLFIIFVMIPAFRVVATELSNGLNNIPPLVTTLHAILGTIAQLLGIYMFLAGSKILPRKIGVLRYWMWTTFVFWTLTVLVGIAVYILFHTGETSAKETEEAAVAEHEADLVTEETIVEITEPATEVVEEHAEEEIVVAEHDADLVTEEAVAELTEPAAEIIEEHAEEEIVVVEPTEEVVEEPTALPTPSPTPAPIQVGSLLISDAEIHGDQVTLQMAGITPPADGFVYEAWLGAPDDAPFSIGRLTVEGDAINHTFVDPEGRNLLGLYSEMFISEETVDDADPAPSATVAYTGSLPPDVIELVRPVVVAALDTPNGNSPTLNVRAEVNKIELETGFQVEYSLAEDDLSALKIQAEGIINIIEGSNGANFGDNDGNGDIYNPGDGVGLLGPEGYLQRVLAQINAVSQAEGASTNIIVRTEQARTAVENVISLVERLRELELQILNVNSTVEATELVNEANNIARMLLDFDGSGLTDPTRAGALAAYTYVQLIGTIDIFTQPRPEPVVDEGTAKPEELIDEHAEEIPELISEPTDEIVSEHDGN